MNTRESVAREFQRISTAAAFDHDKVSLLLLLQFQIAYAYILKWAACWKAKTGFFLLAALLKSAPG
jgi:hypothetical protein